MEKKLTNKRLMAIRDRTLFDFVYDTNDTRNHDESQRMATELLSARQTIADNDKVIERLVKYADHWLGCLSEVSNNDEDCGCGYTALMKEVAVDNG